MALRLHLPPQRSVDRAARLVPYLVTTDTVPLRDGNVGVFQDEPPGGHGHLPGDPPPVAPRATVRR